MSSREILLTWGFFCTHFIQHCFICRPTDFHCVGGCWERTRAGLLSVTLALALKPLTTRQSQKLKVPRSARQHFRQFFLAKYDLWKSVEIYVLALNSLPPNRIHSSLLYIGPCVFKAIGLNHFLEQQVIKSIRNFELRITNKVVFAVWAIYLERSKKAYRTGLLRYFRCWFMQPVHFTVHRGK
jgi:hypothetical protein